MIEPRDFFSAEQHNIKSLLRDGNHTYRIPDYQRNFAWTTVELDQLWDDLQKTIKNSYYDNYSIRLKQKPHFFGTILLTEAESGEYEITDGQQRLTVITIFLKSIVDIIDARVHSEERSGFHSLILPLIQKNDYGEEFEKRLNLDSTVDHFFEDYIFKDEK